MGISVEEVEARVQEALAEMEEPPAVEPAAAEKARERPEQARELSRPARPPRPPRRPLPRPRLRVPAGRRRLVTLSAALLAGVGVLLLVLYLIAGSGGGGSAAAESAAEGVAGAGNVTQATLEPVGDSEAEGRALFGRIRNTAVLQVQAEGLKPSPPGKSYTVWLYRSPKLALRVGSVKVKKSGLGAQFPLPNELLGILAQGAFDRINVSLTDDSAYRQEIARAKSEKRLPAYAGRTVLSGEITGSLVEQQG
jgi:hypothetical protein